MTLRRSRKKILGPGEVISLEDNFIILRLSDRDARFRYPDAFVRGYLECLDK